MKQDLAIACTCGTVTGTLHDVGPGEGDRLTCYCSDCRDFVRLLGRGDDILDDHGGNAVYQTRVAKLELHTGADRLATLHMTEKPTMRWYAACCNTPFFNTAAKAKPPFLSVNLACCDADRRDAVLGPPKGQFLAHEAQPPIENPKAVSMFQLARGFFPRVIKDLLSGDWRKSPLFDPASKEPIAKPRRVTPEERAALGEA